MRLRSRSALALAAAAAACCAVRADAAARPPATTLSLSARSAAGDVACATTRARGPSVARRTVVAPATGVISVRLRGPERADWDLGLVDAGSGRTLNGGAGPRASELADSLVERGRRIVVQACRRSGAGRRARARVSFTRVDFKRRGEGYAPRVVRVSGITDAAGRARLAGLGLDTTDHPGPSWQDVILHSGSDEARLRAAGFRFEVRIGDLLGHSRAARLRERRGARSLRQATALPSGRTTYRTLPEFQQEMKDLAAANPGLVRVFTLPLRSLEGRDIMGIEIAERVQDAPDGRPEYVQVGGHHAREWPANEATLEFGIDLINAYKNGGDPRWAASSGARARSSIPVLNVDGYNASIESEGLNPDGSYSDPVDSGGTSGDQSVGSGAYKRKTCSDWGNRANEAIPCLARTYDAATRTGLLDRGVDPNRNYGVEFGGPGSESGVGGPTYHGPAPFSEVETEALRRWLRDRQPSLLITNHTYTGLILRPPGTAPRRRCPTRTGCGRSATRWRPRPATSRSSPTSSTTRPARPTTTSTGRSAGSATRRRSAGSSSTRRSRPASSRSTWARPAVAGCADGVRPRRDVGDRRRRRAGDAGSRRGCSGRRAGGPARCDCGGR